MGNKKPPEPFTDPTGRRWFNSSVVELMNRCSLPGETPQAVIRRLARLMVEDAKKQGWNDVPYDPEILAELQGIEVRPAQSDIRAEARLMPLPDHRLEIEYSTDAPETRRRFSVFHEIAHTFFPDCYEQIHHRGHGNFDPIHAELEQLCHLGAGELLMPLADFEGKVAGRTPSMNLADELGLHFNASQESAIRRLVDLSDGAWCLLWVSERWKPKEERANVPEFDFGFEGPKPKLRADYQFTSASWTAFIPKHKSVPDSSAAYCSLRTEGVASAVEDWSGLNLGQVQIEAVRSRHSEPDTMGTMILLTKNRV